MDKPSNHNVLGPSVSFFSYHCGAHSLKSEQPPFLQQRGDVSNHVKLH